MPDDYLELARMLMRNYEDFVNTHEVYPDPQAALAYAVIALVERMDQMTAHLTPDHRDRRLVVRTAVCDIDHEEE